MGFDDDEEDEDEDFANALAGLKGSTEKRETEDDAAGYRTVTQVWKSIQDKHDLTFLPLVSSRGVSLPWPGAGWQRKRDCPQHQYQCQCQTPIIKVWP